jgi:hypothetical protein
VAEAAASRCASTPLALVTVTAAFSISEVARVVDGSCRWSRALELLLADSFSSVVQQITSMESYIYSNSIC